jgi:hypothetical protein
MLHGEPQQRGKDIVVLWVLQSGPAILIPSPTSRAASAAEHRLMAWRAAVRASSGPGDRLASDVRG